MTMDPPQFTAEEMALCQMVASVTDQTWTQYLEQKPLYEVSWRDRKKESSWSPALSIIPVTRKSSYGINVNVLQRLRFKGGTSDVVVLYKAITPRDDTVIVTGLEVGVLADGTAPRGFHHDANGWSRLENNEDRTGQSNITPLDVILRMHLDNQKRTNLMRSYTQLKNSAEYVGTVRMSGRSTFNISSPRSFMIAPYHDKTIVVATSCACPPNGFKRKVELDRGSVNFEFGVPNPKILQSAVDVVGQLSRLVQAYATDSPVSTTFDGISGQLGLYLMLEAIRQRHSPGETPITLSEIYGTDSRDRLGQLMALEKGTSSSSTAGPGPG